MPTPGALFAQLWHQIHPRRNEIVTLPWHGRTARELTALTDLIVGADTPDVPLAIETYLEGKDTSFATDVPAIERDERAFVVMCALDDAAMEIHPAEATRAGGLASSRAGLLLAMMTERRLLGAYWADADQGYVIPKGLLTARRRTDEAMMSSGIDLAHQFVYLAFVPSLPDGQKLHFKVTSPSNFLLANADSPAIGLAPVAENANDFQFCTPVRGNRPYLDAQPADAEALNARLAEAVIVLLNDGAQIVVLPELVASPGTIDAVQKRLRDRRPSGQGALVLIGSGLTSDICPKVNRPFNEAVALTETGELLLRQRKLNPFNMNADRMSQCHIAFASGHENQPHMEDIAVGDTLVVCDLPDVGRLVTLICEDLEQETPGGRSTLDVRPDWILTPVLDINQAYGRWTHRRAMELGRHTGSRFVISSSTSLSVRCQGANQLKDLQDTNAGIGILYDAQAGAKVLRALAMRTGSPDRLILPWDPATWPRDTISAKPTS